MATLQRFTLEHVLVYLNNGQSLPLVLCHGTFDASVAVGAELNISGSMRTAILHSMQGLEHIVAVDSGHFRTQFPSVMSDWEHRIVSKDGLTYSNYYWGWDGNDYNYSSFYLVRYIQSPYSNLYPIYTDRVQSYNGYYRIVAGWVLIDDATDNIIIAADNNATYARSEFVDPAATLPPGDLIAMPQLGIAASSYPVDGSNTNISTTVRALFPSSELLDFSEPVPPPTPPDTDPYANIDGEGALPGGADVDLPAEPTLSALDAGMFALFAPSSSQMKALASYLWTDFGGAGTDVVQMLGEVVEALKRTVANPLDLVLGLSIIASQGLSKGGSSNVHVGFWDTGVSMTKLAKQYFTVDCGSITFNPVCGDTFLDYAPYSKFSIFLPYVGTKILDANDVVGHTISVKYRGDCVTGGLVCYLKRDGTIIAEFAGNCALNLPLSADSWGQTISGGLSIVAGAAGGAIKGGAAGAAAGAVASAASVATNPSVLAPQVEYTGAVAGGSGHMGSQKPFILREAVRFHSTSHFNTVTGYPSFYYRKLGDCTGFTQVVDVHLDGLSATGAELTEIESLLKGGVIL